jgi:hypothetical protein
MVCGMRVVAHRVPFLALSLPCFVFLSVLVSQVLQVFF